MRLLAMCLAFLLTPLTYTAAQDAPVLVPGQRVRVTASSLEPNQRVATFVALESNMLVLSTDTTFRISLASVDRLEVHVGRRHLAGTGALVGLGVGATLGAIIAYTQFTEGETPGRIAFIPIGGAICALLGTGIGWASRVAKWADVAPNSLGVAPNSRGGRTAILVKLTL